MQLEVKSKKNLRPVHECSGCGEMIYGPLPNESAVRYSCDECGTVYSHQRSKWPNFDICFIIE